MPGMGHGHFSKAARDKRKRMRNFLSKYDWAKEGGGLVPVPKSPTPPPPAMAQERAPVANPYHRLPKDEAMNDLLHAVLKDDIGTMNLIYEVYKSAPSWMIEAKGSSIGGETIKTPIVFYAVLGTGEALDWLISRGADLYAESNLALSPAVAFAVSKGQAAATVQLLQAMGKTDLACNMGDLHFAHLSDVARHYKHPELALQLEKLRGGAATIVTPALPAPQKTLIYKKTPPKV